MSRLIKVEELALFGFSCYLFAQLPFHWIWFVVLFLAPDLSMVGYLAGPKAGAWTYNLVHHKAIAIIVLILGALIANPPLQLAGTILLGHSSLDRVLGYGLKYPDSFRNTHLGQIGRD